MGCNNARCGARPSAHPPRGAAGSPTDRGASGFEIGPFSPPAVVAAGGAVPDVVGRVIGRAPGIVTPRAPPGRKVSGYTVARAGRGAIDRVAASLGRQIVVSPRIPHIQAVSSGHTPENRVVDRRQASHFVLATH